MNNNIPKTETRFDDLTGAISVNFKDNEDFNMFASAIAHIDLKKYKPIAVRAYMEKSIILTFFALDLENAPSHKVQTGKDLVRKFKIDVTLEELLLHTRQLDFTLLADGYRVDDFDVIS